MAHLDKFTREGGIFYANAHLKNAELPSYEQLRDALREALMFIGEAAQAGILNAEEVDNSPALIEARNVADACDNVGEGASC